MTLLATNIPESHQLVDRAKNQLAERLSTSKNYSSEEVKKVTELSPRLFPKGYDLSESETEQLRALCMLSKCALQDSSKITSHRKFLGPLIVAGKRLVWRILSHQLNETFDGLKEFHSWSVYNQARLMGRISELESRSLPEKKNN